MKIKFGTDGWRAVISEDFTFANVKIVAQAIADFVKDQRDPAYRKKTLAVGYDTRFLSESYAETIASVLAANGISVILADRPVPTPSVSYAIQKRHLTGGVMVTASHNPPRYNGIKYKNQYGASAGSEIIGGIERKLFARPVRNMPIAEAQKKRLVSIEDIVPPHLAFAANYVDLGLIKKQKLRILVDSMYGAGNRYFEEILSGGNIRLLTIHGRREPGFGGMSPEPKLPNLKELVDTVRKERYDVGLATDGDADRFGLATPDGKLVTGHKVMALALLHLIEDRKMRGGVVQTICGTYLINKICRKYGLALHETQVGFKYIADLMVTKDILVGGEETGGIGYKGYLPERDGIITGLLILEMVAMRKVGLVDILRSIDKEYGTYEYRRMDIKYPDQKKAKLMWSLKRHPLEKVLGSKVVEIKSYDGIKFICQDESWLMLRLSGTEPILRIYAEAPTEKKALAMLAFGKKVALAIR